MSYSAEKSIMIDKPKEAIETPLTPLAAELAKDNCLGYADALIMQAKVLAFKKGDERVLNTHMNDAIKMMHQQPQRSFLREVIILIAGGVVSASFQGFVVEVTNEEVRAWPIVIWVVFGLVSLVAALAALFGPRR
jgi:hypothetical protein